MDKSYVKSLLINALGAILLGLGCLLYLSADIGSDAMTTFSQGLSIITNLSFSVCYYGLNIIMMIIAIIMDKKTNRLGYYYISSCCGNYHSVRLCLYSTNYWLASLSYIFLRFNFDFLCGSSSFQSCLWKKSK